MANKRIVYRYIGKAKMTFAGSELRPGQFISRAVYKLLDEGLTIRQEIRL